MTYSEHIKLREVTPKQLLDVVLLNQLYIYYHMVELNLMIDWSLGCKWIYMDSLDYFIISSVHYRFLINKICIVLNTIIIIIMDKYSDDGFFKKKN